MVKTPITIVEHMSNSIASYYGHTFDELDEELKIEYRSLSMAIIESLWKNMFKIVERNPKRKEEVVDVPNLFRIRSVAGKSSKQEEELPSTETSNGLRRSHSSRRLFLHDLRQRLLQNKSQAKT